MAAHNEEAVLPEKLRTLAEQDYPGSLNFWLGSDNSSDRTEEIITRFCEEIPFTSGPRGGRARRCNGVVKSSRTGKPGLINELANRAGNAGIYVITDAGVLLAPNTVTELVRPMLSDPSLGVVDARMVQTGARGEGVGRAERAYIDREVAVKIGEGRRFGRIIGPFGGCWAIRAAAFDPVPPNFLVDDFYLCMRAYERGFRGRTNPAAVVYEPVGQRLADEYRRKVRIGAGNWQNLVRFHRLWFPPWQDGLARAFFSHKVLRWWTPFFLLLGGAAALGLVVLTGNHWVALAFGLVLGATLGAALTDLLLARFFNVHLRPLRAMRYFLAMNAALLHGFFRYLSGIHTNVWQPSNRA